MAKIVSLEAIGEENSLISFSDGCTLLVANLVLSDVLSRAPEEADDMSRLTETCYEVRPSYPN